MGVTRKLLLLAVIGAAVAGAYEFISIHKSERYVPAHGPAFVTTFRDAPTALDLLLAESDGQFYAAIAEDPLMKHPERFPRPAEVAYRWQRPALPYVAWTLSLGRQHAARTALAIAVALSAGFAAASCGAMLARRGASPGLGLAVILLPGSLIVLRGFGPELLALGFGVLGLMAFEDRKITAAAVAFAAATLSRESLILLPAGLAVYAIVTERRARDAAIVVALPLAALLAWWVVVHAHVQAWPWDAGNDRIAPPWHGLVPGIRAWSTLLDPLFAGLTLLIPALAVARRRSDPAAWAAAFSIPFALVMGSDVWRTWESFGRPVLPVFALGLISLLTRSPRDMSSPDRVVHDAELGR